MAGFAFDFRGFFLAVTTVKPSASAISSMLLHASHAALQILTFQNFSP
jgi:hypothetical protein